MYATRNTLSENIRAQSVGLLNRRLAAAIDLQAQLKQAHWNVRGPNFIAIHMLFDKVAGEAAGYADLLAERAGGLGGTADGTVQNAAERTFLLRYPFGVAKQEEHVFSVCGVLAAFGEFDARSGDSSRDLWRCGDSRPVHRNLAWRRSAALAGRIPCGAPMTDLPTADLMIGAEGCGMDEPPRQPRVLDQAEDREQFAPPEVTRDIAAWVNEGGAGGEVRK